MCQLSKQQKPGLKAMSLSKQIYIFAMAMG